MARTTYTEISHKLTDVTAKIEAEYTMADLLAYTSFDGVKTDDYIADNIASDERNYNILDGSLKLVPDDPATLNWGAWTDSKTDENGDFAIDPVLTATFISSHTSSGITFTFAGDSYPNQVSIEWYNGASLLASGLYDVDSMVYFAKETVENYDLVEMTFIGTSLPRRHIKFAGIDYGEVKVWSKDGIMSASILEEVNLTSSEITINTLDFSIHDESEEFNMLNPEGVYVALQQKQKLTVKEYVNGSPILMGKFFLNTWKNTSPVIAQFTAYDSIGLFDTIPYITSPMWDNDTAGDIFDHIFAVAGWTDYTIDPDIAAELVSGYIPIGSVRNALHNLCLALRCSSLPNRSGTVEVKRLPSVDDAIPIEKAQIFGRPNIIQNALVNSVAVKGYDFPVSATSSQLFNGTLAAGTYQITFNQPATSLSISGATITGSGINYADITVAVTGAVVITGYPYMPRETLYVYEAPGLTASNRSQKTCEGIYLVNVSNAAAIAQFLYEDYQRRIVQKFSLAATVEKAGDNVDVDTMLGARKTGAMTLMDINLTGGFIANVEVRG